MVPIAVQRLQIVQAWVYTMNHQVGRYLFEDCNRLKPWGVGEESNVGTLIESVAFDLIAIITHPEQTVAGRET